METSVPISARPVRKLLLSYTFAFLAMVATTLVCGVIGRFAERGTVDVLLLTAVAFSAWYCGLGPSILALVIALFGITFGFIPHIHAFHAPAANEFVHQIVFLASSAILLWMGETRRRQNEASRAAQNELEVRVRERTADLDAVNKSLRELSARLMQLQDDERRRIARELHDSVGQTLAALGMNLSLVRRDIERLAKTATVLNDSEDLVRDMSTEVRTISHLLHPPLLDEAGLISAIRWYVDGFARRSGIKVDFDAPEEIRRLPPEMETAIFRVVQECLTNIHRHSESPIARIRLQERHDKILVRIEDRGKGIPPAKLEEMATTGTPGLGIRGMRERLRQLNGTVNIASGDPGTIVTVQLPVQAATDDSVPVRDPAAA